MLCLSTPDEKTSLSSVASCVALKTTASVMFMRCSLRKSCDVVPVPE